jgi:hypothetical protein
VRKDASGGLDEAAETRIEISVVNGVHNQAHTGE